MPKPKRLRLDSTRDELPPPRFTQPEALRLIGEVVYAARMPDGTIKIGHTTNLARRRLELGEPAEVIAFTPGTRADEQAIHASLRPHRHHGHEWYNPTAEVLSVVNDMRARLGLHTVAA